VYSNWSGIMALKDLIASKSSLAEEVIEEIVGDFVRYDPDEKSVVFTPEAHGLSNRAKVLIYLVAIQGWPYVVDGEVPVDAKPAEIEEQTGVIGGSLRPTLKELKDRNIISEKSGRYSARSVGLQAIKAELNGDAPAKVQTRQKPRAKKAKASQSEPNVESTTVGADQGGKSNSKGNRRSVSRNGVGERFYGWIQDGYFDQPKTLSEVQAQFHNEAIIIPRTSLPSYLLKAVRDRKLTRAKATIGNKLVWTYRRAVKS
jgi:hypothetical protein